VKLHVDRVNLLPPMCVKRDFTACQNVRLGNPHVRVSDLAVLPLTSETDGMVVDIVMCGNCVMKVLCLFWKHWFIYCVVLYLQQKACLNLSTFGKHWGTNMRLDMFFSLYVQFSVKMISIVLFVEGHFSNWDDNSLSIKGQSLKYFDIILVTYKHSGNWMDHC